MTDAVFTTIMVTGFTVAFLHAAIPTHWLPFVLTARVQKWSRPKTLLITMFAGCGHVLFTALLGVLVAWGGMKLSDKIGTVFPLVAGGALLLFGLYQLIQQWRGKGHGHSHAWGGHGEHAHEEPTHGESRHGPRGGTLVDTGHGIVELTVFEKGTPPQFRLYFYDANLKPESLPDADSITITTSRLDGIRQTFAFRAGDGFLESLTFVPEPHEFQAAVRIGHGNHVHSYTVNFVEHDHNHEDHDDVSASAQKSDVAAISSLLALLTFSPCEGFLPVYMSGVKYGWPGFVILTLTLSIATVGGMVIFTWLTLAGMEKLKLGFLEKYERGILGGTLCALGLLIMIFEH